VNCPVIVVGKGDIHIGRPAVNAGDIPISKEFIRLLLPAWKTENFLHLAERVEAELPPGSERHESGMKLAALVWQWAENHHRRVNKNPS
jgi:hypothetical protein